MNVVFYLAALSTVYGVITLVWPEHIRRMNRWTTPQRLQVSCLVAIAGGILIYLVAIGTRRPEYIGMGSSTAVTGVIYLLFPNMYWRGNEWSLRTSDFALRMIGVAFILMGIAGIWASVVYMSS